MNRGGIQNISPKIVQTIRFYRFCTAMASLTDASPGMYKDRLENLASICVELPPSKLIASIQFSGSLFNR